MQHSGYGWHEFVLSFKHNTIINTSFIPGLLSQALKVQTGAPNALRYSSLLCLHLHRNSPDNSDLDKTEVHKAVAHLKLW